MIAHIKPYPEMKNSGVPWLGEVPAHWEVVRLKSHLLRNDSGVWGDDFTDKGTMVLRSTEQTVTGGWKITAPARINLSVADVKSALLKAGDLVVTKSSGSQAHIGKTSLVDDKIQAMRSCFSNFMQRLRVDEVTEPAFVWQNLNSPVGREQLVYQSTTTTGLGNLNGTILGNCQFAFPPLPEQTAIVRYLDYVDRRIRRYIRAKQKLIGLLEEQKQAIIHRAVTRGLDPDVRLKPSGVEWLGDVPEHWEVVALRRRWRVTDCKHLTVPFVDSGVPLASVREAQSFELNFEKSNRTTQNWYEKLIEGGRKPKPGDLIYCRNVCVGAATLVTTDKSFAMGQDVCLIRSATENQRWLNYFLRSKSMSDQLALILVGSTFNRINVADIKALVISVPPRREQDLIAAFLDEQLLEIDAAISICQKEQTFLNEYRTRLIADVVTGKLDVREAAARLPEEVEGIYSVTEADEGLGQAAESEPEPEPELAEVEE